MSQTTIEERVRRLEELVDRLLLTRTEPSEPGRDDWKKTFGAFAGDAVMKEIIDAGRRIRQEDRERPEP